MSVHWFHSSIFAEDFPLRGKQVLLHIKRQKRIDKYTDEILQRNVSLIVKGTRITQDFAMLFLN
ncbi:ISAon1 family transposase N-terminal region protein [Chryseobacterium antibioticum]